MRIALAGLRAVGWAAPVVSLLAVHVLGVMGPDAIPADVRVAALVIVFGSLVARALLTAWTAPGRRVALTALAAGLVLWLAGAAVLNSAPAPDGVAFPAPGEAFFLASYLGFAAWLVLDRSGAPRASVGGWLDAVIVCGATAGLAGFVVVSPLAGHFAGRGTALLTAAVYPLIDMVMLVVVTGQVMLRQRRDPWVTGRLVAGLGLFAVADLGLATSVSRGTYSYGEYLELAWCVGFLLLGDAACVPSRAAASTTSGAPAPQRGSWPVVGAAAVALVALTLPPPAGLRAYVAGPAVVTLLATGLRLVLALRASHQLNEAIRLSVTDDLTGLPNRRLLNERLSAALARPGPLGLLLLDLDGFKEVNDSLGHASGDLVLQATADRLRTWAETVGLVVRLGGDEFAVLVAQEEPVRLLEHAAQIQDVIRRPVRVDGLDVTLGGSIGVAIRTAATLRPGDLLRQADVAMYQAKAIGAGALLYDVERDEFSRDRLRIAEDLRVGIEIGQLEVWYQPKVAAATGAPCGVEALIRWRRPGQGVLAPGAFLPAARRAGLMPDLTAVLIREVVADLVRWRAAGLQIPASLNVAPPELLSASVMAYLIRHVREAGLGTGDLVVEVTEDSFLTDPQQARVVIEGLRHEGVGVSIDDYGTGFSSLSYLRDLPVQEIKIDRSFVADLLAEPRDHMIVRTTNELAKGLGLRTVAEGVEDADTALELRRLGIDSLQGYFYSRPLPAADIPGYFSRQALASLPRAGGHAGS